MCSGTPVCAVRYLSADEQVAQGRTGLLFEGPEELCSLWKDAFVSTEGPGIPAASSSARYCPGSLLQKLTANVEASRVTWHESWLDVVPAFVGRITKEGL
jgi:hypothetical protein